MLLIKSAPRTATMHNATSSCINGSQLQDACWPHAPSGPNFSPETSYIFTVNCERADPLYASAPPSCAATQWEFSGFPEPFFNREKGAPLRAIINFKGCAILEVGRAVPDVIFRVSGW